MSEIIGSIDLKNRIISDPKEIARLEKLFGYQFFVHPNDRKIVDADIVLGKVHLESARAIGLQLTPIRIAVKEDDEYANTDSEYRVMGRPFDGTHRYLETAKDGVKWQVQFTRVESYDEFCTLFHHFNTQKDGKVRLLQLKRKLLTECNYMYDIMKITPKEKIGRLLVKKYGFNHPYSTATIYNNLPSAFVNKFQKTVTRTLNGEKHVSKKDEKMAKMQREYDSMQKEVFATQDRLKQSKDELNMVKDENNKLKAEVADLKRKNADLIKSVKERGVKVAA